jgi:hypothetical protein
MWAVEVATPLAPAIAAASAHGLTDLALPPRRLAPYAVLLFPTVSPCVVTPVFLACSLRHFSHDVGAEGSALLHALFAATALVDVEVAWSLFCLYYCLVHVPRHALEHAAVHSRVRSRRTALAFAVAVAVAVGAVAVAAAVAAAGPAAADARVAAFRSLELTDRMQLAVVAHVAVEEVGASLAARPRAVRERA